MNSIISRVSVLALLVVAMFVMTATSVDAQVIGSGTQPSVGGSSVHDSSATPKVMPKKKFVKPCNEGGNGDVTVTNSCDSDGNASIDPAEATDPENTDTTVKTYGNFEGTIDGVDAGDSVSLGYGNSATVNGNGGTVSISKSSTVTVNNAPGGSSMTVNINGTSINLPPGSSMTANT